MARGKKCELVKLAVIRQDIDVRVNAMQGIVAFGEYFTMTLRKKSKTRFEIFDLPEISLRH